MLPKGQIPLLCVLFLAGCAEEEQPQEYAARVHNEYLTRAMISEKIDESLGMNEAVVREYITQWINTEMLYQEARRRGLDRDERVLGPLQDIRRHLAINALLEDEVYGDEYSVITDQDAERYYSEHMLEFRSEEPIVEVSYALFERRNVATTFRNAVVQGTDWNEALERVLDNADLPGAVLEIGDRAFYRQRDLYPVEKWNAARQLATGGTSFPISTGLGFYIIRLHASIQTGNTLPFDFVKNEIGERLVIEKRHEKYQQLLQQLRRQFPIEISFSYGREDMNAVHQDTLP